MLSKVRSFADEHHLLLRGERIVAGVSGGADSAALFYVLLSLREERGFSFSVLHVHHGIRGEEADRDEAFVISLAKKYGVAARSVRLNVPEEAEKMGLGLEEAGRILRRRELLAEMRAQGAQRIALAHHRDDLAETVLMNLARGTGLAGLGGIRPAAGPFIRPLLGVGRADIEAYLEEIGASYVTDATNMENVYTRNRLRNEILPELAACVNPKTNEHIAAAAAEAAEAFDYLSGEAEKKFRRAAVITCGEDGGREIFLPESLLDGQPAVLAGLTVRFSFSELKGTLRDVTREHVRSILALLHKDEGREVHLPYGLTAVRVPGGIRIGGARKQEEKAEEVVLAVPGRTFWGDWTFTAEFLPQTDRIREENKCTKWIDYDKIKGNLVVRTRKNGDFIAIHPDGRKKTISNLMTDKKVPQAERDRLPLIAAGQEVLLVPGIRTGESCRVDNETVRALRIGAAKNGGKRQMSETIKVMIPEEEIDRRTREIGDMISRDYAGKTVHMVTVLKGGVYFMTMLSKRISENVPVELDFMSVSSYGDDTKSSGIVRIVKDLDEPLLGKDVLVIEDIIDSGRTLYYLLDLLRARHPASLRLCTLLDKPERRVRDVKVDYTGFEIEDRFVVGCGMDYAQKYRNLPYIGEVIFEGEKS